MACKNYAWPIFQRYGWHNRLAVMVALAQIRDLKKGTETLIIIAQVQEHRKNYIKHNIENSTESRACGICGKNGRKGASYCDLSV